MEQLELFENLNIESYKPYKIINGNILWDFPYKCTDGEDRPKCLNIGCKNPVALSRGKLESSINRTFRTVCADCHKVSGKPHLLPAGVMPVKKTYCENINGKLGFKCTTTILYSGQLELDHIDGIHSHNISENIQTLCKCCHSFKSYISGDFRKSNLMNTSSPIPDSVQPTKTDPTEQNTNPYITLFVQK
jgi:hypothetical protein